MSDTFDPYYKWLAIPPEEQPPNYYRLLGVKLFESDVDVIANAADARMAQVRTFQNGEQSALSQKLLNELATARVCLLKPEKKQAYDQKLKAAKSTAASKTAAPKAAAAKAATPKTATPIAASPKAATSKSKFTTFPAASDQPKFAESQTSGTVAPMPLDFGFGQETAEPTSHRTSKNSQKQSMLVPLLAGGVCVIAGIAAGVWFLGGGTPAADPPTPNAPLVAQAAKTDQPAEHQDSSPKKPADLPTASAAESAIPVSAPPASAPTIVANDPPATPAAVPDKPVAAPPRSDGDAASAVASAPTKETSPAAEAARPDAASRKPDAPEATDDRNAVPTAAARKAALDLVLEVYKDDYAKAKKPADKLALAEKLLKQAEDETDAVQRFTLLSEVRTLALAGSSPKLLAEVADQLGADFVVDGNKVLADSLDKLAEKTLSKTVYSELAEVALSSADQAAADDQFDQATRLANLASNAAKKAGHPEVAKNITARLSELNDMATQYQTAHEAETRLAANPDDAEAHLALGKYLCFGKGDWDAGNPHLAKSNDPALKPLAEQELQAPADPAEQVKLADGWWDLAEASTGAAKVAYQHRAATWYQQAQEKLTGLTKARVEKRVQSLVGKSSQPSASRQPAKALAKSAKRPPLVKEAFLSDIEILEKATDHNYDLKHQVIVNGVVSPHGLFMHPVAQTRRGYAAFKIAGRFRKLEGRVSLNDGAQETASPQIFSVFGDGQLLWQSKPLRTRADEQAFSVNVKSVDRLDLVVESLGTFHAAQSVWIEPQLSSGK